MSSLIKNTVMSDDDLLSVNTDERTRKEATAAADMDHNTQQLAKLVASSLSGLGGLKTQLSTLQESQAILLQKLLSENTNHQEALALYNFPHMFDRLSQYTQKAHKLGHDMNHLSDRTNKLKERTSRLMRETARRAEQQAQQRARQEERERLLIARPAWQTQPAGGTAH